MKATRALSMVKSAILLICAATSVVAKMADRASMDSVCAEVTSLETSAKVGGFTFVFILATKGQMGN